MSDQVSFRLSSEKKVEEDLSFNLTKKVTLKTYDIQREIEEKKVGESYQSSISPKENSNTSSSRSYPLNHRYENCANSDDEVNCEDGDFDDDDEYHDATDEDDNQEVDEESFHSYFGVPSRQESIVHEENIFGSSPDQKSAPLGNLRVRDWSRYTDSVLKPVANLSDWKAIKARELKPLGSINSSISISTPFSDEEILADTSLSNWLVSTETTPSTISSMPRTEPSDNGNSQKYCFSGNHEDRPILGASTVEELKQSSSSSSRRSSTWSADEIPIVGSVGIYWNHSNVTANSNSSQRSGSESKGIQSATNKNREVLKSVKNRGTQESSVSSKVKN